MKLKFINRAADKKSESNRLRREGSIPAIIYQRGKEGQAIAVNNNEYQAIIRKVQPGRLSTHVFILVDENGKEHRAILKEIQYKVTNYDVLHLDFEELLDDVPVNVKVPIECTGVADCIGVKLGGVLRQVIRHIRVRCLPKDIPNVFTFDVKNLNARETRRLKDLEIPQTIRPLTNLNEVAVAIVKR
jgi:large subunit ribosomal protein L25